LGGGGGHVEKRKIRRGGLIAGVFMCSRPPEYCHGGDHQFICQPVRNNLNMPKFRLFRPLCVSSALPPPPTLGESKQNSSPPMASRLVRQHHALFTKLISHWLNVTTSLQSSRVQDPLMPLVGITLPHCPSLCAQDCLPPTQSIFPA
jgi:hypothetical protein